MQVNANNESELKEMSPSIRFKARQPPNFYWKNKEPKDSSQQVLLHQNPISWQSQP
jgi:hypothetical protein